MPSARANLQRVGDGTAVAHPALCPFRECPLRRVKLIIRRQHMRSPGGESERGSVIDFALIVILFSIVLITIAVLLGPAITDFFSRLVVR